jgi:hypothetical protein
MHFICIALADEKRERNCVALEAVSSRPEIQCQGEGAPVVIPGLRADFRAQNRLDFRRLVRIGVAMGRPSHRWKRKRFQKRRKTACGLCMPAKVGLLATLAEVFEATDL